jgi:N-acetylglucosaminyldiphosphoundecaprenol N-acetyl-beta-D-mannosaminyltransferase
MASPQERARATILGCPIDRLGMDDTVDRCVALIESRGGAQQISINAAKLVAMRRDPQLRALVDGSAVVSADGQSIVWASRLLGDPLPERVAGIDLMYRLVAEAARRGYRVYFLGARPAVLDEAIARLRRRHPQLLVAGRHHGYFDETEAAAIRQEIERAGTDILLLAMGSPHRERWLTDNVSLLSVPLIVGVGGSLDVTAGVVRRAPRWAQRAGLEWAFRMLQEPRRLVWRYVATNVSFMMLVLDELAKREPW